MNRTPYSPLADAFVADLARRSPNSDAITQAFGTAILNVVRLMLKRNRKFGQKAVYAALVTSSTDTFSGPQELLADCQQALDAAERIRASIVEKFGTDFANDACGTVRIVPRSSTMLLSRLQAREVMKFVFVEEISGTWAKGCGLMAAAIILCGIACGFYVLRG